MWPMVGRGEELAWAREHLATAPAAGIVLAGPTGIGKSRLAAAIVDAREAAGDRIVRVVGSHATRDLRLGALVDHLPDDTDIAEAVQLRRVARALAGDRGDALIAVEDAHLLDNVSAEVVAGLAAAGTARVVVTVRTGEPAPAAVRALGTVGAIARLDLQPLGRSEIRALANAALDGDVDVSVEEALWRLSEGVPLLVRQVLLAGQETGTLTAVDRCWTWRGSVGAAPRLADIVQQRLARLPDAALGALEVIAAGEPLDIEIAERVVEPQLLGELERAGMVRTRERRSGLLVETGHPLYGEVAREGMPVLVRRAVLRRLVETATAIGLDRVDVVRVATWSLDAGIDVDPDLLVEGALTSRARFDTALFERLARAAVASGAGWKVEAVLISLLYGRREWQEMERLLGALPSTKGVPIDEVVPAVLLRASALVALRRADEADALLQAYEKQLAHPRATASFTNRRALIRYMRGEPAGGVELARSVLDQGDLEPLTEVGACVAIGLCACARGRTAEAVAAAERGLPLALSTTAEIPSGPGILAGVLFTAYVTAGRLDDAEQVAESVFALEDVRDLPEPQGVWTFGLGLVAARRGLMRTALEWLETADRFLAQVDNYGLWPWALGERVAALSQLGRPEEARAVAGRAEEVWEKTGVLAFEGEAFAGVAWALAASGDRTRAVERLTEIARRAEADERQAAALHAWYDAVRLGGRGVATDGTVRVAGRVDGVLAPALGAAAAALAGRDGSSIADAGSTLAELGYVLHAAELMRHAGAAHERGGRRAEAVLAGAEAERLLARCEGAVPLAVPQAPTAGLTAREEEVVLHASAGATNREIADSLGVSVRTVENHLHSAFSKLGVSSRADLRRPTG